MIPFDWFPTKGFLGCSQSLALHSCGEYLQGHCFASVQVFCRPVNRGKIAGPERKIVYIILLGTTKLLSTVVEIILHPPAI